jgi:predicted RNA-binding Zn-ribbon protein involved in translation (DUF1610 family)
MTTHISPHEYPCAGCGARVEYAAGTSVLRCPYCGHEQPIAGGDRAVREHDIADLTRSPREPVALLAPDVFPCAKCGAQTTGPALSLACQFCGAPLVRREAVTDAQVAPAGQVAPEAVLPFAMERAEVRARLRAFVSSRRFAPSSLKTVTEAESVKGMYLPHWTFDAHTRTRYTGQRGTRTATRQTYTTNRDGETMVRNRQEDRVQWTPVAGEVTRDFDDVLVPGTDRVAPGDLVHLEPWPLAEAQPYRPDYLAGYHTLRYDVEPEVGLDRAKRRMTTVIRADCRRQIGGDAQRLFTVDTTYSAVTYKLVLLPVWVALYLHGGRSYRVLVNACTGTVVGDRPFSRLKVVLAIAAVLAVIALLVVGVVLATSHRS